MTNLHTESIASDMPRSLGTYNETSPMKSANGAFDIDDARWQTVLQRDRVADGAFVFGVVTTGVYCRPSCPARRPLRRNVRFFSSPQEAEKTGLRACLRCKPANGAAGNLALVRDLCRYMEANTDKKITLSTLSKRAGISRFHLQRIFTAELGISPAKYLQSCRFSRFKQGLRRYPVTTAWAEAGYSSSSRIYESAHKRLGMTPSRYRKGAAREELRFTRFNTPLGPMVLVAGMAGVCAVQFTEDEQEDTRRLLQAEYPHAVLRRDEA